MITILMVIGVFVVTMLTWVLIGLFDEPMMPPSLYRDYTFRTWEDRKLELKPAAKRALETTDNLRTFESVDSSVVCKACGGKFAVIECCRFNLTDYFAVPECISWKCRCGRMISSQTKDWPERRAEIIAEFGPFEEEEVKAETPQEAGV